MGMVVRPLALAGLLLGFPSMGFGEEAEVAYALQCAGCHRFDGSGLPPDVPTLIDEPGRIEALPGGRDYLIRIPGVAQAALDDEHLAAVLNYMLITFSANSLAADFRPYDADEIARYRGQVLKDPLRRRGEIVQVGQAVPR